jgi:hypothetical protein
MGPPDASIRFEVIHFHLCKGLKTCKRAREASTYLLDYDSVSLAVLKERDVGQKRAKNVKRNERRWQTTINTVNIAILWGQDSLEKNVNSYVKSFKSWLVAEEGRFEES